VKNPIDLTGDADITRYEVALDTVISDENVDAILLIFLFQVPTLGTDAVERVVNIAARSEKPIVVVAAGGEYTKNRVKELEAAGLPCYETPERGIRALAALCHYQSWKKEHEE
jgi:acyl-CoA synthetase (NDP forming)